MEFHFLRPLWLLALLPWTGLLWLLIRRRLSTGGWERVCDPDLLPHVLEQDRSGRRRWPVVLIGVAGLVAITALAGPSWDRLPQPLYRNQGALVLALDLSRSMDAADLTPSRLAQARYKISDILNTRPGGMTALLVYAGEAFTVTPLSTDTATIESLLGVLSTDLMPAGGSRADRALEQARNILEQAGFSRGDILLVTDNSDLERSLPVAKSLRAKGYRLSVLGVGTADGAPVPTGNGGLLKDSSGGIVIPQLEAGSLAALARAGGGLYQTMRNDNQDIERLQAEFAASPLDPQVGPTDRRAERWRDRGPWLVLLLIPLAALGFRRGLILGLLVLCLPYYPPAAQALDWQALWQRADERGQAALAAGEAGRAAELFRDPEWQAVAHYRNQDYRQTLEALESVDTARGWYNRGNALARLGQYSPAIAAYERALELEPAMDNARYNRDLLRKQLQQQQRRAGDPGQEQESDPGQADTGDPGSAGQSGDGRTAADGGYQSAEDTPAGQQPTDSDQNSQPDSDSDTPAASEAASPDSARTEWTGQAGEGEDRRDSAGATEADADEKTRMDSQLSASDEQRLQRIPEDPGGLLRRKFQYQYQRRYGQPPVPEQPAW